MVRAPGVAEGNVSLREMKRGSIRSTVLCKFKGTSCVLFEWISRGRRESLVWVYGLEGILEMGGGGVYKSLEAGTVTATARPQSLLWRGGSPPWGAMGCPGPAEWRDPLSEGPASSVRWDRAGIQEPWCEAGRPKRAEGRTCCRYFPI